MRFWAFMVVSMKIPAFRDIALCSLGFYIPEGCHLDYNTVQPKLFITERE